MQPPWRSTFRDCALALDPPAQATAALPRSWHIPVRFVQARTQAAKAARARQHDARRQSERPRSVPAFARAGLRPVRRPGCRSFSPIRSARARLPPAGSVPRAFVPGPSWPVHDAAALPRLAGIVVRPARVRRAIAGKFPSCTRLVRHRDRPPPSRRAPSLPFPAPHGRGGRVRPRQRLDRRAHRRPSTRSALRCRPPVPRPIEPPPG